MSTTHLHLPLIDCTPLIKRYVAAHKRTHMLVRVVFIVSDFTAIMFFHEMWELHVGLASAMGTWELAVTAIAE